MSNSKPPKPSGSSQDVELLKSDVASFASSLGFSSSLPSSGFDDADFRKTGRIKPNKRNESSKETNNGATDSERKTAGARDQKPRNFKKNNGKLQSEHLADRTQKLDSKNNGTFSNHKPKSRPPVLSLDDDKSSSYKGKRFDKYKNLPKLPLMKASAMSSEWYKDAGELEEKVLGGGEKNRRVEVKNIEEWKRIVEKKRELGERLMWQYAEDFDSTKGKTGDLKMVIAAQKAGTEADKVTAFEIMVGENPIANLRSLDALLGMVTSKVGKRYAFKGFKALAELFIKLLPDRKLKTLLQRPINNLPETKDGYSLFLFWYWEECLKQRYERFVFALEEASRDMLPQLKDKALKTLYALLSSKSEQERRLLSALVNKLGDPQNKTASNADFYLSNLLSDHPNMKAVVIEEVDAFLFRPRLGLRAKYHAVNFLSQIRLSHKGYGPKVAKRLIDVYFALFKVLITEADSNQPVDKGEKVEDRKSRGASKKSISKTSSESHVELDSRLLSALLTGINRAFPYVSSNEADDVIEVHTPMLFQLIHSKNFNVGVQALMLLHKISSKNQIVSDRFYRALYSKLLLPSAMNSSKAEMFVGLLLRAMKSDVNLKRVSAFSKRLLQIALQQPPQYACGFLFLLSEVLKARPPLWNMVLQNESPDEDFEHFEDVKEENDAETDTATNKEDAHVEHVNDSEVANSDSDSFEEDDMPASDSDDEDASVEAEELLMKDNSNDLHRQKEVSTQNMHRPQVSSKKTVLPGGYDPRHREPSYCNADRACWWELTVLASHVHPSVATMAGTLLSGTNIVYNGNPLNDLSLAAFLDKFMEKKPKASTWHGGSQIEPSKKLDMTEHLIGPEILSLAEVDVPPEDLVFHKFYVIKINSSKKSKKKKKKKLSEEAAEELYDVGGNDADGSDSDDIVDGDDESDNEEIENMLDAANPSLEEESDYDYDKLDAVVKEDDDELVGDLSDIEMDEEDFGTAVDDDSSEDDANAGPDDIDIEDVDSHKGFKKRKREGKRTGASPFASFEEYKHLIDEDNPTELPSKKKKRPKHAKKKRILKSCNKLHWT